MDDYLNDQISNLDKRISSGECKFNLVREIRSRVQFIKSIQNDLIKRRLWDTSRILDLYKYESQLERCLYYAQSR